MQIRDLQNRRHGFEIRTSIGLGEMDNRQRLSASGISAGGLVSVIKSFAGSAGGFVLSILKN